jgi:hypothetical protein
MAEDFGPNGALQGIVKEPKLEAQDKSLQQDFVDWAADNLQGRPGTLGSRIGLSVDPYTAYKYSRKIFGDMNSADPEIPLGIGLTDFTPMGAVFALDQATRDFEGVGKKFEEGDTLGGAIDAGLATGLAALSVAEIVPGIRMAAKPVKGFIRSLGGKLPPTAPSMVSGPNTAPMEKLIQLKPMTDQFGTEVPDAQKYLDSVSKSPPLYDEANRGAIVAPEPPVVDKITPEPPVADKITPEPPVADKITPEPPVADKITPEPPAADIDPQGFYSAMSRAVDELPQKKGNGSQMLAMIAKSPGVKAEEMSWTGLDDFLKGKKNVTKAEIQEYVDANQVRIEEVVKGGRRLENDDLERLREIEATNTVDEYEFEYDPDEGGFVTYLYGEPLYDFGGELRVASSQSVARQEAYEEALESAQNMPDTELLERYGTTADDTVGTGGYTKFGEYTLPGGENYREVLLKMPQREVSNSELEALAVSRFGKEIEDLSSSELNQIVDMREGFRSGHYDEPNVLAHIRLNDRTGPDGERILFVEEIQSDWHQKGREKGYTSETVRPERRSFMLRDPETGGSVGSFETRDEADQWRATTTRDEVRDWPVVENVVPERKGGVPDAPLKKTWQEASLRRVLRMAAEEGYDSVAWTPGRVQAERYDLSSQISEIYLSGPNLSATGPDGETVISQTGVKPEDLPGLIGKEVADRLLSQEVKNGLRSLTGEEIEVGGEGMKGFYDKMIKNYANKFGKKFGAKVGTTKIQSDANVLEHMDSLVVENEAADGFTIEGLTQRLNRVVDRVTGGQVLNFRTRAEAEQFIQNELVDTEVWNLPITKNMRNSVLEKGVPLFGAAGLVAAGQEPNEEKESF